MIYCVFKIQIEFLYKCINTSIQDLLVYVFYDSRLICEHFSVFTNGIWKGQSVKTTTVEYLKS